ncbi:MAG TPA: hypothetical protein VNN08_20535 [Thermoanaerobaculia bacterium]|nr:hypothetical protein [Thermoanaerobaculia bacterium]
MRTQSVSILLLLLFAFAANAGDVPDSILKAGHAPITIRFSEKVTDDFSKLVESWVHDAADAVMTVYERYPVKQVTIEVQVMAGGRGVGGGKTFDGRLIKVRVSPEVTRAMLRSDWVMTHEMFHLGFPDTEANWLGEGLSTYMEPLARARAGQLSAEEVWGSMIDGFPKGLPGAGDQGLDETPTWGRTYWGGALFWLLADIEIRRKSGGHKSLDDVLRAIDAEGGTGSSKWPEEKIFRRGDAAIGMPILEELHARLGMHPETTDLAALWRQLGVSQNGRTLVFNDDAPLAGIRRALTAGKR